MAAFYLFRGHIVRCTHELIRVRNRKHVPATRKAKIDDFDDTFIINKEILWLNVAVEHVMFKSSRQSFGDLVDIIQRAQSLHCTVMLDIVLEILPINVVHNNIVELSFVPVVNNAYNMHIIKIIQNKSFTFKTLNHLTVIRVINTHYLCSVEIVV